MDGEGEEEGGADVVAIVNIALARRETCNWRLVRNKGRGYTAIVC